MSEVLRKKVFRQPISKAELERRWKAVRTEMAKEKLDCLVTHSANRFLGGMVRYFTDMQMSSSGGVLVFPLEGEMTLITHGAPATKTDDTVFNAQLVSCPYIPSMNFVKDMFPAAAVEAIKKNKAKTVGIVEKTLFPLSFFEYMKENLPDVTFKDATDMVEAIRAIKSPEEIDLMWKTAAMQDKVMLATQQLVRPGVREYEIMAEVKRMCLELGSEEQLILIGSGPKGTSVLRRSEFFHNRTLQEGDYMAILIETNGPGGLWTEIARNFCIGDVPKEMQKAWSDVLGVQKELAKAYKPGAHCKDLWDLQNKMMVELGYPAEDRLSCHSQGYDIVERPVVRPEETMDIKENMVFAIHPFAVTKEVWIDPCQNYHITPNGGVLMHKCPMDVFVV